MIKIGDKVEFNVMDYGEAWITGRVIELHKKHHWFAVEYCLGEDDTKLRTSFHFADLGVNVYLNEAPAACK